MKTFPIGWVTFITSLLFLFLGFVEFSFLVRIVLSIAPVIFCFLSIYKAILFIKNGRSDMVMGLFIVALMGFIFVAIGFAILPALAPCGNGGC